MFSTNTTPAEAALAYASHHQWHVFPCFQDKTPRTPHGFKDATRDTAIITAWWERWPDASIGIATGEVSGIFVLDVDPAHGGADTLRALEATHQEIPNTPQVLTGGGGAHCYLAYPGFAVTNSAGKLGEGLDVRCDGGYVIAPPSSHPSGGAYAWEILHDPEDTPLAPVPPWLLGMLAAPAGEVVRYHPPAGEIVERTRNTVLFKTGCAMRAMGLDVGPILAALRTINTERCNPVLDDEEVVKIAGSVSRYAPGKLTTSDAVDALAAAHESITEEHGEHPEGEEETKSKEPNPLIQSLLSEIFGIEIEAIIQQGVENAHYSVKLAAGLMPLGNAKAFLDQETWRELMLNHGIVPFNRQKQEQWAKILESLLAMVAVEEEDMGTAEWLRDIVLRYSYDRSLPWVGSPSDADVLRESAPFSRDDNLYIHTGDLQEYMARKRISNAGRSVIVAALRALGFTRGKVFTRDKENKVITRWYWSGSLPDEK